MTPLDKAHAAMQAATEDGGEDGAEDAARLRFYERLADAELFVLLSGEASGGTISPELFETEAGRFVLAFDLEERLVQFNGTVAPYAAMSGRVLAQMLDGPGIGLGLNLGVAPSAILLPSEALAWLNRTLAQVPARIEARIEARILEIGEPAGLPEALIAALAAKLARAAGLAQAAYLVDVFYETGGRGHLLGFVGVVPGAQGPLAKAAGEALTFAGIKTGAMDVGFFANDDPVAVKLALNGVRLELPQPASRQELPRPAPGRDPDKPPILR